MQTSHPKATPAPDAPPDALTIDYVRTTAAFLGLPLDDGQVGRVAVHLARTRTMVQPLQALPLAAEDEPPELFIPAPFPPPEPSAP